MENTFKQYRRKSISEMRPYVEGEGLIGVSVSEADLKNGSPKVGDMIARNPKNHEDQWLVAKEYFNDNLEPIEPSPSQVLTAEEVFRKHFESGMRDGDYSSFKRNYSTLTGCVVSAIQEYSTLQTQQLQNRVKELEEQLSVMPTRKHQIVSEVVELREQVKQARNGAIQECIAIAEKELEDTDDHAGYVACDNVINKLKEKLKIS